MTPAYRYRWILDHFYLTLLRYIIALTLLLIRSGPLSALHCPISYCEVLGLLLTLV